MHDSKLTIDKWIKFVNHDTPISETQYVEDIKYLGVVIDDGLKISKYNNEILSGHKLISRCVTACNCST